MITLIQFPGAHNRPSYSPFCLKLETYLKIAKIPYENKLTVSTANSKKKKMPMIIDKGELIEDSTFIIEHLKKNHGVYLDSHLTAEQKAVAKSFQWLCEKSLIDIIMSFRWGDEKNWPKFRDIVFHGAPWIIKATVANVIKNNVVKTLHANGTGRFSETERLKLLDDNLAAISNYLGNKKYFFGDQVSSIDTIIYAHLIQAQPRGVATQLEGMVEKYPNLISYLSNFTKTYWPQYL
jgi:glutathione S-transferase